MSSASRLRRPEGRYGTPSRVRRRLIVVILGVVVGVALGWLLWAAWFHATPKATSEMVTYDILGPHEATARVDVALRGDAEADEVTCKVQAISADHTPVGEESFTPVDGSNEVSVRTEREATSVSLIGCTAQGQPRPR